MKMSAFKLTILVRLMNTLDHALHMDVQHEQTHSHYSHLYKNV
jgi:hypothetical protein